MVGVLKQKRKLLFKKFFAIGQNLGFIFLVINLLLTFIFASTKIFGQSMEPNLSPGERILSWRFKNIRRGNIIIFKSPNNSKEYYIKRVIGLPGDKITMKNDQLYINHQKQKEPYLNVFKQLSPELNQQKLTPNFTLKKILHTNQVPANSYFVMGDNRQISEDSRSYGFIKRKDIIGVAFFKFWPIGRWQFL